MNDVSYIIKGQIIVWATNLSSDSIPFYRNIIIISKKAEKTDLKGIPNMEFPHNTNSTI
jgi:tRNA A37 N6-isopentenylltransferase MiaA